MEAAPFESRFDCELSLSAKLLFGEFGVAWKIFLVNDGRIERLGDEAAISSASYRLKALSPTSRTAFEPNEIFLMDFIVLARQVRWKPFALRSVLDQPSVVLLDAFAACSHRMRSDVRRAVFNGRHHDKRSWHFGLRKQSFAAAAMKRLVRNIFHEI
ncbi:MAG: hypothetical protein KGK33_11525 [Hyphomicrobiales bacterium]|nr:hypothetical protein [Hyphomicrobiales bacterium]